MGFKDDDYDDKNDTSDTIIKLVMVMVMVNANIKHKFNSDGIDDAATGGHRKPQDATESHRRPHEATGGSRSVTLNQACQGPTSAWWAELLCGLCRKIKQSDCTVECFR